ncbi:prepilin-type N-terminal cleavage/methylation domain-containing protein [Celerinatantimonas sp. MCCC 1A17872]|uniref:prepilin-type N-terminal cleavage/methylation domain-containing protein n=1 Tax=Celerinatantimonas sp. MCCC 1A17872 TaxID=3177514 RepID=UPI0038BE357E
MSKRSAGFTLLEMLAALMLMAIFFTLLVNTLTGVRQSSEKLSHHQWQQAQQQLSLHLLTSALHQALPIPAARHPHQLFYAFSGGFDFVAPLPRSLGSELATYQVRIAGHSLWLQLKGLSGQSQDIGKARVLLGGVHKMQFKFLAIDAKNQPHWLEHWSALKQMPRAVALSWTGQHRAHRVVIAIMADIVGAQ